MKYFDSSKITIKNLWYLFLTFAIPMISVCGASPLPYYLRLPLIYCVAILFVFVFVFSDIKITINAPSVIFFLLLTYIGISAIFSLDREYTIQLLLIYLCCFVLLFIDLPADVTSRILNICYVICIVIAFSIIISAPIKECMNNYFWFIVNPSRSSTVASIISNELKIGAYSGFARERGEAAYILNVGLAISFSKYFSKGKYEKKDLFFVIVLLAALLLTGKRTHFVISIVCFCSFMLISKIKGKSFVFLCILLASIVALFIIMMFIPKMANMFNRLMDSENISSLGGRESLWDYLFMMISKYWMFGCGFGAYNQFSYNKGLRVYDEMWTYNAHNSYLQLLGEIGIIGFTLLILFIVVSLFLTFRLLKKAYQSDRDNMHLVYFSLYIQIMVAIYSVTGNPLYTKQMLFTWLFAVGISLSLDKKLKKSTEKNKFINGDRLKWNRR